MTRIRMCQENLNYEWVRQEQAKLQIESAQHTEDYMKQSQQIHNLNLLLQQEQIKGSSTMVESIKPKQNLKPTRRFAA